jgi:hypothetical protein
MTRIRLALSSLISSAALLLIAAPAAAQPSQPPPPQPGPPPPTAQPTQPNQHPTTGPEAFHPPGLTFGFDLSLGGMSSDKLGSIECFNCDFQPISGGFGGYVGIVLNPRLAIKADLRATAQTLDADGTAFLVQTTFMGSLTYWLTPRVWIEGGLGVANLSVNIDDGFSEQDETVDNGGAGMLAAGFEVARGRRIAIDLHVRGISGSYDGINDQIFAGMVGVAFTWYPRVVVSAGAGTY